MMEAKTSNLLTYESDFSEFIAIRDRHEVAEIDQEMFYYWLEVLPPTGGNVKQNGESFRMNGMGGIWTRKDGSQQPFSFAFAEGAEFMTVFWLEGSERDGNARYFGQLTHILNPRG